MARDRVVAGIDVGTTKICTLVGTKTREGETQVIGVGITPAKGLRKGIVVSIDDAVESIRGSIERAERSSGYKIASAQIGVSGGHISSSNNRGVVAVSRGDHIVTAEDVTRAIESARAMNLPSNREIIHVVPRSYAVDGQEGVHNPIGMHGFRLDVETHIVTGAVTSIQNLTKCVQRAGVEVEDLVLTSIASSEAILSEEEREMGVVLADIGGGTTDVAVFLDGSVLHTAVLPVGGYYVTNDIAIGLRTPFAVAEEVKQRHAHALPASLDAAESVGVATFGSDAPRPTSRRHLAEIVEARVEEIISMIMGEVKRAGFNGYLAAGMVLCGGTAELPGIDALASQMTGMPVRIDVPRAINGLVDSIVHPGYATSVGLLLWGLRHAEAECRSAPRMEGVKDSVKGSVKEAYSRFSVWMKELLPQ